MQDYKYNLNELFTDDEEFFIKCKCGTRLVHQKNDKSKIKHLSSKKHILHMKSINSFGEMEKTEKNYIITKYKNLIKKYNKEIAYLQKERDYINRKKNYLISNSESDSYDSDISSDSESDDGDNKLHNYTVFLEYADNQILQYSQKINEIKTELNRISKLY